MRPIKFRAWTGATMYNDVQPNFCYKEPYCMIPDNNIAIYEPTGSKHYWLDIKVEAIMQFTGLKDKAGVEIYEGDIVESEIWVSVGEYERCTGIVTYKMCKFLIDCILDWEGSDADLNLNATVIGNIYQHPELLKSKTDNNG
jgi:uncharacterized phage protein (TIGR01671 family)